MNIYFIVIILSIFPSGIDYTFTTKYRWEAEHFLNWNVNTAYSMYLYLFAEVK